VLALIAEGLTDRGIGERLWLSQSTVETHVRHILRKLDLPVGASYNRRVARFLRTSTARAKRGRSASRLPRDRSCMKSNVATLEVLTEAIATVTRPFVFAWSLDVERRTGKEPPPLRESISGRRKWVVAGPRYGKAP
jgi:hypothetical protein